MTTIYWPSILPDRQFLGITYKTQQQTIETQMESGPPQVRRRFSAGCKDVELPNLIWTGAQVTYFEGWWDATLGGGANPFAWRNPMTGAQVSMQFRGAPPEWSGPLTTGLPAAGRLWRGAFSLRVLP